MPNLSLTSQKNGCTLYSVDEQASEGVNKVMEILKYMYIVQQWGGQVGSEG